MRKLSIKGSFILLNEIKFLDMAVVKVKLPLFISSLLILVQLACAQVEPKPDLQYVEQLDQKIPEWLEEFIVPGAAFALIESGELVLLKGYGYADAKNQIKVDEKTGFNIASISKTVTAWGVMKLVEGGKIDLDSAAEKYLNRWHLPVSKFDSKGVTIRRLLSHTAGLSLHGYPGWSPADTLPSIEESLSGKTNGSGGVSIIAEPGSSFQYSGGGYTLLQLIIEEVTARKFSDYMQTEVLNPLGMTNSSFRIDKEILKTSSLEHNSFGDTIPFELFTAEAAAGLHTTIEDLSIFTLASLNRPDIVKDRQSVLNAAALKLMTRPDSSTNRRYGLGYSIQHFLNDSVILVGHGGSNDGWKAYLQLNQETGDGFVMITNGASGDMVFEQAFCEWTDQKYGIWLGGRCLKSVVPLLVNSIKKDGIDAAINKYHDLKVKAKDEYYFSEGALNQLGYELLWRDSLQQAIEIFKMIIDEYPKSFNAYDSYGEALLADGKEKLGIEYYIKSVKLNPDNKNAVRILESLGVSMDSVLVSVSVESLKLLEGEYIATKTPHKIDNEWKIKVEEVDGLLFGQDKDYRYRLLPVEENKFINPDDGTSLIFDIKNQASIVLVISDKIEFKKIN